MNLFKFSLFISALVSSVVCSAAEPYRVGDFTLLDHQGKSHQLSYYGDQQAVVIFIQGNGSPAVQKGVLALNKVKAEFEGEDIVFFMLNPQAQDTRQTIAKEAEQLGYEIPVLVDEAQLVAESFGVERLAETLIIDPKTMMVTFRGAVDDLGAVLSGAKELPAAHGTAEGSMIAFHGRDQHLQNKVSYTNDIVPILENNCVSCHHDGAIAPWSMSSHGMILGWSAMMREVVMTRRMPPGQIDPHVGKPLQEVAGLTVQEKQKLIHWIDAGSPVDGAADPLTALTFNDPKFSLGEPDLIYTVSAQSIPATGVIDYRYVPVELNLDRDVWVRAMEFIPGDRQALHHVIAYLSSPADKTARGRENGSARGDSVGGFAPGRQPDEFRDNSGRLIRKGSNLLLQMHYTATGKETTDETQVGIFIHEKPPAYVMAGGVAGQRRFFVPAYAKEHKLEGEQLIERDAFLYSMTPHMHFRGKYMSYTAEYPDGTSEVLLSVPKYDFNWQFSYQLKEPLFLPAGTRLVAKGAMDNSDRNPSNPDPSKPVHFGLQTMHEMFFGFTTLRYKGDTPEGLAGDNAEKDEVAGL
jgi:peroxiredoxin